MLIHAGNWTVPQQLMVRSPQGNNNPTPLPYNTSLFNLKTKLPPKQQIVIEKGISIYSLQAALVYSTPTVFTRNAIDARTVLLLIRDALEVLPILLENGHTTIAGRLSGAFSNLQRDTIAEQIMKTMKQAGYDVRKEDPFEKKLIINLSSRERSPFVNRIKLMWLQMREIIIGDFPAPPVLPTNHEAYLQGVDEIYITDAYHSLSIERYKVTPDLIEKVSSGEWNSNENDVDRKQRDAMAARGYTIRPSKV